MARPVCQNRITGAEVEEELCNLAEKPEATLVECNTHNCPPKYGFLYFCLVVVSESENNNFKVACR